MGGSTPFREALKARLDLINPTFQQLEACIAQNPPKLSSGEKKFGLNVIDYFITFTDSWYLLSQFSTPLGIKQVVNHLHARGTVVFLVSGGFRQVFFCCCFQPKF